SIIDSGYGNSYTYLFYLYVKIPYSTTRKRGKTVREFTQASVEYETEHPDAVAADILGDVLRFRRGSDSEASCAGSPCPRCLEPHLARASAAIRQGKPVTFVLPAFPGKSPNPAKVLGPLPDMAERHALEFLQYLCDRISERHWPGARIILCSDGRVFSDAVGMRDEDVTAYQD